VDALKERPTMKIMKTLVGLADAPQIIIVDTISYKGKLWLVPKWLETPALGVRRPERMVPIDDLPYQKIEWKPGGFPADYSLEHSIPTPVLTGALDQGKDSGYEVVASPDIHYPLRTAEKKH
jgi:hypothetical protein